MVRARLADFQFIVFDARRGLRDGTDLDKVLAVYPAAPQTTDLLWAVGLFQGLATFAQSFGQTSDWMRTETQRSVWLSVMIEPGISLAMAVNKAVIPRHATEHGLHAILILLQSLVHTLHGGVQALLDKDVVGDAASHALTPLLRHVHDQLSSRRAALARELRNPFSAPRSVRAAPWPRRAALAAQSMDSALRAAGRGAVAGTCVLAGGGGLAWTSLWEEGGAALAAWAANEEPAPGPSTLLPGTRWETATPLPGPVSPASALLLRQGAGHARLPVLHLGRGSEAHDCLVLSLPGAGLLLVVVLTRENGNNAMNLAAVLQNAVEPWLGPFLKDAARDPEFPAHLPGFRYMVERTGQLGVWCSPRQKVSAMSHIDRAMAAAARDSLSRLEPLGGGEEAVELDSHGGPGKRGVRIVLARATSGGSWVVARRLIQGNVLAVRQGGGERTVKELLPPVAEFYSKLALGS